MTSMPHAPIFWGELIDKITILEIKVECLRQKDAVANATRELELLLAVLGRLRRTNEILVFLRHELSNVNRRLWDIEDGIREKEARQAFDAEFIELARGGWTRRPALIAALKHAIARLNFSRQTRLQKPTMTPR
jgi:Family of unknown function (DUF6165)